MSSRALRKAQKRRELVADDVAAETSENEEGEEEGEVESGAAQGRTDRRKQSAFAMLSEVQDDDDDNDDDDDRDDAAGKGHGKLTGDREGGDADEDTDTLADAPDPPSAEASAPTPSKKKPKKKKKAQKRKAPAADVPPKRDDAGEDEIDAALKSLALKGGADDPAVALAADPRAAEVHLLAVEPQHLNVANEMRRLFGRAAFSGDQEEREDQRRGGGDAGHIGLAEAVSGRAAAGGPGLSAALRKRNILVQGKEEWPRNTANGLGMELEGRGPDGAALYRFTHNQQYRVAQLTFMQGVAMMDPNNLINMLRHHPYHVATLLQVSEIAKQEKDHATCGELIERALFAFGKALHPSFARDMQRGTARLDFRRPENREFFLAAWRYVGNVGMRATWRTAYEWARLVFALDPDGDPYGAGLALDQLGLRARQPAGVLALIDSQTLPVGGLSPGAAYSRALAWQMLGRAAEARADLADTIAHFPWVAARLYRALDAGTPPSAVWGAAATAPREVLYTELYATLAKDVWALPDSLRLLTEVAAGLGKAATAGAAANESAGDVSMAEGRHVVLTDVPALIGLLPRWMTNRVESMSDPLPPDDTFHEFEARPGDAHPHTLAPGGFYGDGVDGDDYDQERTSGSGEDSGEDGGEGRNEPAAPRA